METTKVIFRKWKHDGSIIALFPEIPADLTGRLCLSYEHIGQHGGADYNSMVWSGKAIPAKSAEYAELKKELEKIGYCLEVRKKATREDFGKRKAAGFRASNNLAGSPDAVLGSGNSAGCRHNPKFGL